MTKKILLIGAFAATVALLFVACNNDMEKEQKKGEDSSDGEAKTIYEKIEDVPAELKADVEKIQQKKGYSIIKSADNKNYVFIGLGEKPTAGYGVDVKAIKETEDMVVIEVDEIKPAAGQATAQVISYPFVLLRLDTDMEEYEVINSAGEKFVEIKQEESGKDSGEQEDEEKAEEEKNTKTDEKKSQDNEKQGDEEENKDSQE